MSTLEALYFPGTQIYSGSQFPAFLLFSKIHLLQPVESDETTDNSADIFTTVDRCQAHTPCPLGESKDRFLHLIRDIRERKDDYAAQLSSLTVAAMSEKKSSVDDTTQGIITSLLGGHGVPAVDEGENDVQLWQARLLLKIAEILETEEEEVAMQMALLDDEEDGLFKELQGELNQEEETLIAELRQLNEKISRPSISTIRKKLSAWNSLYKSGESPIQKLWLTSTVEAADILLEKYAEQSDKSAEVIAEIQLPANLGWNRSDALKAIELFQQKYKEILDQLRTAISNEDTDSLPALTKEWNEALAAIFAEDANGRTLLTIYKLADSSCIQILNEENCSPAGTLLSVIRLPE